MRRFLATAAALAAATLALAFPVVFGATASASTAPVTRISWGVAKDACLTVPNDHAVPGQALAIKDCAAGARDQSLSFGNGHLRLHGTGLYATVGQNNVIELSPRPGPANWVYGPTHTVHIGKGWLTYCGPGSVFYYAHSIPHCQTWYAFTQASSSPARCSSAKYVWNSGTNYTVLGGRDYGEAEWTSNPGNCQSMQVKISCVAALTGQLYSDKSGVVRGTGIEDKAKCGYGDQGLAVAISLNGGTYKTLCTQPATGSLPSCNFGITRKG